MIQESVPVVIEEGMEMLHLNRKTTLISLVVYLFLLLLLYLALLYSGPSEETVRSKIAVTIGIPSSELVYSGGYFRRESKVLFRYKGNTPFINRFEEVQKGSQLEELIFAFLKEMNTNLDCGKEIKVLKFPMEFDTVVCIVCGKDRWVVFYGNTIM